MWGKDLQPEMGGWPLLLIIKKLVRAWIERRHQQIISGTTWSDAGSGMRKGGTTRVDVM